jgi:hypothetical protein
LLQSPQATETKPQGRSFRVREASEAVIVIALSRLKIPAAIPMTAAGMNTVVLFT